MPWVLAALAIVRGARCEVRRHRVAIAFALQALCGEPVTWVCHGVALAFCYALLTRDDEPASDSPGLPAP